MFKEDKDIHRTQRAILLDSDSPIKNLDAKTGKITINNAVEEYIYNCSRSLGAIDRAIDKSQIAIQQVKTCLSRIPKNSDFSTAEYMEYSIENYIIRSRSIHDRTLIFVGNLFDLGISNDSITHLLITTNQHVKKNKLDIILKTIKKACDTYQYKRNVIIHHDSLIDEQFDTVSTIINAHHLSAKAGMDEPFSEGHVKYYSKQIIKSKVDEYNKNLNLITECITSLYDACEIIYLRKKLEVLKGSQ